MTDFGGDNDLGVIFSIGTDGSWFTLLHEFAGNDGEKPRDSLIHDGSTLYGMTCYGGDNDLGVVFSYALDTTLTNKSQSMEPTAVNLLSFNAKGQIDGVKIEWKTAQELNNFGFDIYRAMSQEGPFIKLNDKLIAGLHSSVQEKHYHYKDCNIIKGKRYYYKLEDIDIWGVRTQHGPICMDWDGDDFHSDYGIMDNPDPVPDNANLNMDHDKLSNLTEYAVNRKSPDLDSDNNNIPNGEEGKKAKQTDMVTSENLYKESFITRTLLKATTSPPLCIAQKPPLPVGAAYKILLYDEGIYSLTRDEFKKFGVEVDELDISKARLFNLGKEVAIYVYDEDGDNQLDSSDYIQFFGESVPDKFKKYAKNNVYWLTMGESIDTPKRMEIIDGIPKDGQIPETFRSREHYEEEEYYLETMPGDDDEDRWLFSPFALGKGVDLPRAGEPVAVTIHIRNGAGEGNLKICLYGTCNVEHEVEISLNNTPLGKYTFSGIRSYQAHIEGVDLREGTNILAIKCIREIDSIGLDWFDVEYPRVFVANDNQLLFSYESGYRYHITGFSDNEIQVFDITIPSVVARIVNGRVTDSVHHAIDFEPHYSGDVSGKKRYMILTQEAVKTPLSIAEKSEFTLKDKVIGVNYIIITCRKLGWDDHGTIYPWLHDLLTFRERQGLKPIVVNLSDIYDEFSYGMHTPQAIKDFLLCAYNNKPESSPLYVVLLGDSSYDYTNNWNLKEEEEYSYVLTYLITTPYKGESASDEWFVRTDDNKPIPDLCIGRLPATNTEQAEVMVKKILSYETTASSKSWEKNMLLVADNITKAYETAFETMNNEAASLIPPGMNAPFKGYLDNYSSPDDCAADIKTKINEGCLIVNYNGHGWGQIFAKEGIFKNDDIASLTNKGKLPFFVSMTCMAGYFINPESLGFTCMAEALLRAEGKGAIAALMPTAMSTSQEQQILNSALYYAIFTEDIRTLGTAIARAKQIFLATGEDFERITETFLLFGDPAVTLKIPLPRRPTGVLSQGQDGCITLSWKETKDCHGESVAGYNCYRSTTPSGNYYRVNNFLITETCYRDQSAEKDIMYYYVVTSVDTDGYESVPSQHVAVRSTTLDDVSMLNTASGKFHNGICRNKYKYRASISACDAELFNSEHVNR